MATLKNLISKTCDISLLKGVTYESFSKQNKISKIVSKNFLKAKKKDKIKTSECIICGSKKLKFATVVFSIEYLQCQKCSHVMRKYSYTRQFLLRFWKRKGDVIAVHSDKNQQKYRKNFLSMSKVEQVLKYSKKKKNFNWLDCGCGNGEFLESVRKKGIRGFGFDLNEKDIKLAKKKKLNVIRSDMKDFDNFNNNSIKFDVVSATGYFDVINDPDEELKIVNRKMNKNGVLMIDVPNYESVTHDMIRLFPNESIRHLSAAQRSSFTLKSLKYFLNKNGFKPIFRWVYGLDLYMIMNYLTLKNHNVENSTVMSVLVKRYNDFQKIFDEEKTSGTLFIIAKKIKEI